MKATKYAIKCSISKQEIDEVLEAKQDEIKSWKDHLQELQNENIWLLYFSMPKLLQLQNILFKTEENTKINFVLKEINFLTCRNIAKKEWLWERTQVSL